MTPIDTYNIFVSKVNALDTARGVNPDKRQFVMVFNEVMPKWIWDTYRRKVDSREINLLEELLVLYAPVEGIDNSEREEVTMTFKTPADFFIEEGVRITATKEGCETIPYGEFVRPSELEVKLSSSFHTPSFEFEQVIVLISGPEGSKKLDIFVTDDFGIKEVKLTYYRLPPYIDIAGYIRDDGSSSKDEETGLSDFLMTKILDAVVNEFYIRVGNQQGIVLEQAKLKS
jgi:hypothetical protein